jgi:hypothetical protein
MSVVVYGCGIPKQPAPAPKWYVLNTELNTPAETPTLPGCLRMRNVTVQSPFSGISLIYRTGDVTYEKDYYNQFLVAPHQSLNDLLTLWLRSTGAALCMDGSDAGPKRLTLEPHLEALYADFRTPAAPKAVAKLRFVLTQYDRSCRCSSIVLDQTFETAISLPPKPTSEAVVEAMSGAVKESIETFDAVLRTAF